MVWVLTICQDCLEPGLQWLQAEVKGKWMLQVCWGHGSHEDWPDHGGCRRAGPACQEATSK